MRRQLSLVLLAVVASCVSACDRRESAAPPSALPPVVRVVALVEEEIAAPTRFNGVIKARFVVDLTFKIEGTVEKVARVRVSDGFGGFRERDVQEGDSFPKNTVLAQLDTRELERRIEVQQLQVDRARAAIQRTEAAADVARRELERIRGLFRDNAATRKELDEYTSRKDLAEAEATQAVKEASAAALSLVQSKDRISDCTLVAPFDNATVVSKNVDARQRVLANTLAFRVMDLSSVHVSFGVPDTMIGQTGQNAPGSRVQIGQELDVFADTIEGKRLRGRVTKIAPSADPNTRTFQAEITLDNPNALIKPGMNVTVSLGGEKRAALLPMTAIQPGDDASRKTVFVVDGAGARGVVHRRDVEVGGVYDNRVEVRLAGSRVYLGDRVVTGGAFRLTEGMEVRIEGAEDVQTSPSVPISPSVPVSPVVPVPPSVPVAPATPVSPVGPRVPLAPVIVPGPPPVKPTTPATSPATQPTATPQGP